jgi:heat shock protein HtpX
MGLIAMSILAPLAAMIIQSAISRSREYMADASGASICGNPEWLASALEKLGYHSGRLPMNASPSTAHMLIVNPLSGMKFSHLFSTHPPLEDRIARLRGRSGGQPQQKRDDSAKAKARATWDQLSK